MFYVFKNENKGCILSLQNVSFLLSSCILTFVHAKFHLFIRGFERNEKTNGKQTARSVFYFGAVFQFAK